MYFHEYFVNFDGDFGAFDESGSYNFVTNKRPPFSLSNTHLISSADLGISLKALEI